MLRQLLLSASGQLAPSSPLGVWAKRVSNIVDSLGPQGQGSLVTTNDVATVVPGTTISIPLNSSARVTATTVAELPDGTAVYSITQSAVYRHPATGLVQEGATQTPAAALATGGFAATAALVVVGSTVVVKGTGVAATSVHWRVQISATVAS